MAPKVMATPQLTDGGWCRPPRAWSTSRHYLPTKYAGMDDLQIKDYFWSKESGALVFENGTRSDLCFDRRTHPEVKNLAHMNVTYFDQDMRHNMKQRGCSQGLEDPAADPQPSLPQQWLLELLCENVIAKTGFTVVIYFTNELALLATSSIVSRTPWSTFHCSCRVLMMKRCSIVSNLTTTWTQ